MVLTEEDPEGKSLVLVPSRKSKGRIAGAWAGRKSEWMGLDLRLTRPVSTAPFRAAGRAQAGVSHSNGKSALSRPAPLPEDVL